MVNCNGSAWVQKAMDVQFIQRHDSMYVCTLVCTLKKTEKNAQRYHCATLYQTSQALSESTISFSVQICLNSTNITILSCAFNQTLIKDQFTFQSDFGFHYPGHEDATNDISFHPTAVPFHSIHFHVNPYLYITLQFYCFGPFDEFAIRNFLSLFSCDYRKNLVKPTTITSHVILSWPSFLSRQGLKYYVRCIYI